MKKVVVLLDLDGVLATRDIAFDLFKSKGWGPRFKEASEAVANAVNAGNNFDGKKAYAGQTLEYVMKKALKEGVSISRTDIENLALEAKLMTGAKGMVKALERNENVKDVFVISTTFKPAADVIALRLGIHPKRVFATELRFNGLDKLTRTKGPALGGIHKAKVVDKVSWNTSTPLSRMIAIGDSITDIGMMSRVIKGGGLGIAFNAHNDLLRRKPNVIYAGRSIKPVSGLVKAFASNGHAGIKKIVDRNIRMRRLVGIPMTAIGRPFTSTPRRSLFAAVKGRNWLANWSAGFMSCKGRIVPLRKEESLNAPMLSIFESAK